MNFILPGFPKIYNTFGCLVENGCQESPHTWRMSSFLLILILMAGVIFTEPELSVDVYADADAELRGCYMKNGCQEPPHTWRKSSILLRSLMVIMMVGVISIEVDFP